MTSSFLRGFAETTGMTQQESSEQWAAFSRMLSNAQIRRIERGGYTSGVREGKRFRKLYPEEEENPTLRAQVRRLPTGEVQLKIPLTRNPASLKSAMKYVRKLGKRVKSVVVTGVKGAKRNPLEPGLNPTWYRKGQAAGRNTKWKDMYDAWHWVKGKPTISGKRVTAQESFFQGWFDATQRP